MRVTKLNWRGQFLLFLLGRSYDMDSLFRECLAEAGVKSLAFVHFQGLQHNKAIQLMQCADALLCFNPHSAIAEQPSKIPEYMQCGVPIVYVSKAMGIDAGGRMIDPCARMLERCCYGITCTFEKKSILNGLQDLVHWANNEQARRTQEFDDAFETIESGWFADCTVRKDRSARSPNN